MEIIKYILETKVCTKCKTRKHLNEFAIKRSCKKDGKECRCRKCKSYERKQYREICLKKNPEKFREQQRLGIKKWANKNPEKAREIRKLSAVRWRDNNREEMLAYNLKFHRVYNHTPQRKKYIKSRNAKSMSFYTGAGTIQVYYETIQDPILKETFRLACLLRNLNKQLVEHFQFNWAGIQREAQRQLGV